MDYHIDILKNPMPKTMRKDAVPPSTTETSPSAPARESTRKRQSAASRTVESPFGAANSTADRAIDILLLFTDDKPFWSANEIAAHFGMPKTTVYRYVNSLRSYALIEEDGNNGFRLGPGVFPLARTAKSSMSIIRIALPHMQALVDKYGEMVVLQQRVGYDMISLDRINSPQRINLASTRTHILPWPATASAKLLLAYAPDTEQEEIFRMLSPTAYTPRTLPNKPALRVELDKIRRNGYATTDEERDEGVWGAGAPVFDKSDVRHAVAIAAPKFRVPPEKIIEIIEAVKATAARITADLAHIDF